MKKWLVAWDFPQRPKTTFYQIYHEEFSGVEYIQSSVVICPDDFTARRLRALLRFYGANVIVCAVSRLDDLDDDDTEADREADEFIIRIHQSRLSRRGRKPSRKRR